YLSGGHGDRGDRRRRGQHADLPGREGEVPGRPDHRARQQPAEPIALRAAWDQAVCVRDRLDSAAAGARGPRLRVGAPARSPGGAARDHRDDAFGGQQGGRQEGRRPEHAGGKPADLDPGSGAGRVRADARHGAGVWGRGARGPGSRPGGGAEGVLRLGRCGRRVRHRSRATQRSRMKEVEYLLIGGFACGYAAAELRKRGADGDIMVVGREQEPPYERPPLSKEYLRGEAKREDAYVNPASWYEENGVELRTGTNVMSLDAEARTAKLQGGDEVSFEKALIATGANVNILRVEGANLDRIHYLRAFGNSD